MQDDSNQQMQSCSLINCEDSSQAILAPGSHQAVIDEESDDAEQLFKAVSELWIKLYIYI